MRHSHVNSENLTNNRLSITWKPSKIGSKLVLITDRKLHMGFLLLSKLVTLNYLERCNGHVVCVISLNSVAFCTYYVKVVGDTPIRSGSEM